MFLLFLKEKNILKTLLPPSLFLSPSLKDPDEVITGKGINEQLSALFLIVHIILQWPLDHSLVYTALCFKHLNLEKFLALLVMCH